MRTIEPTSNVKFAGLIPDKTLDWVAIYQIPFDSTINTATRVSIQDTAKSFILLIQHFSGFYELFYFCCVIYEHEHKQSVIYEECVTLNNV